MPILKDDTKIDKSFHKVVDWLKFHYNVDVVFDKKLETQYIPQECRIIINNRYIGPRKRLYFLLHEIGHVIILSRPEEYGEKFSKSWNIFSRGIQARVETIKEEIVAWELGAETAKMLDVEVDMEYYNKYAAEKLMTYLKWAVNPRKYII